MMKEGDIYIDIEQKAVAGCCKAKDLRKQIAQLQEELAPASK